MVPFPAHEHFRYLEARTVVNTKQTGGVGGRVASDDFDSAELQAIRRIAQDPDVFRSVVNSLCPSIYGHELVKAGLCLTLFGGTQRKTGGGLRKEKWFVVLYISCRCVADSW
jgi:DNA helicase MCM8